MNGNKGKVFLKAVCLNHRLQMLMKSFFNNILNFWINWTDQANFWNTWGIFSQKISPHLVTMSPLLFIRPNPNISQKYVSMVCIISGLEFHIFYNKLDLSPRVGLVQVNLSPKKELLWIFDKIHYFQLVSYLEFIKFKFCSGTSYICREVG